VAQTAAALALPRQPFTLDWRLAAACLHADPDLFFPVSSTCRSVKQVERAKAVCAGCRVRSECLKFALVTQADGVWGGLTEEEREQHMAAFAELERDIIHERTTARLAAARAQGRNGRLPTVIDADKLATARALRESGESTTQIATALGVSRSSVYRALSVAIC
jgi:WhiB family redox-sensing transcriptional regulator